MITRYLITTAAGSVHRGLVQGSGGRLRGARGLMVLRRASLGLAVNVYDPTSRPPFLTGPQEISHVAVYETDGKAFETVDIRGAIIEIATPETP
jgi:hypothetical protein